MKESTPTPATTHSPGCSALQAAVQHEVPRRLLCVQLNTSVVRANSVGYSRRLALRQRRHCPDHLLPCATVPQRRSWCSRCRRHIWALVHRPLDYGSVRPCDSFCRAGSNGRDPRFISRARVEENHCLHWRRLDARPLCPYEAERHFLSGIRTWRRSLDRDRKVPEKSVDWCP